MNIDIDIATAQKCHLEILENMAFLAERLNLDLGTLLIYMNLSFLAKCRKVDETCLKFWAQEIKKVIDQAIEIHDRLKKEGK